MSAKRQLPIVTLILIAANIFAAYALTINPDLVYTYGFKPASPSVRASVTSLFLHENLVHLLGNMIFLAAVGASVEALSGSFRFASVYFVSGLIGVVSHFVFAPRALDAPPLVGASGAVAGCVGYYCARYLKLKVPVVPKLGATVATVTVIWLALQIVGIFVRLGDERLSTSYWAHIGGFVAGFLISFIFRAPDIGHLQARDQMLDLANLRSPSAVIRAAESHLKDHPNDTVALGEMANAYSTLEEHDKEAETLVRMLDLLPESQQAAAAHRLCQINQADRLPSLRRTMMAERFKASDPNCSKALLLSVMKGPKDDSQRPDAMLALAGLLRETNKPLSDKVLKELANTYPLHPSVELARAKGWLQ